MVDALSLARFWTAFYIRVLFSLLPFPPISPPAALFHKPRSRGEQILESRLVFEVGASRPPLRASPICPFDKRLWTHSSGVGSFSPFFSRVSFFVHLSSRKRFPPQVRCAESPFVCLSPSYQAFLSSFHPRFPSPDFRTTSSLREAVDPVFVVFEWVKRFPFCVWFLRCFVL